MNDAEARAAALAFLAEEERIIEGMKAHFDAFYHPDDEKVQSGEIDVELEVTQPCGCITTPLEGVVETCSGLGNLFEDSHVHARARGPLLRALRGDSGGEVIPIRPEKVP